jgi:hypothetical protein
VGYVNSIDYHSPSENPASLGRLWFRPAGVNSCGEPVMHDHVSACLFNPSMEGNVMKTIKMNAVVAGCLGAGTLLMTPMISSAAEAGQGWDTFNSGDGERITVVPASAYQGTSLSSAVGQGWDAFNSGDGEKVPAPNPGYKRPPLAAAPIGSPAADGNAIFGE